MRNIQFRLMAVAAIVLCLFVSAAVAQQTAGKKEFTFNGKIDRVDANAKRLIVAGEKVEGWMQAMTMAYRVDKEEVLKTLKPGDQITAKVYEGDYATLHDVKVVPPKK